jgi:hypothetical protein
MEDGYDCEKCGAGEFCAVVQHGSYTVACKACGWGPSTSFIAIAPRLEGTYRAVVIDGHWREIELLGEGSGPEFMDRVGRAAQDGAKVLITPLGS